MLLLIFPLAQWLGKSYANAPKSHTHSLTHSLTHTRRPIPQTPPCHDTGRLGSPQWNNATGYRRTAHGLPDPEREHS